MNLNGQKISNPFKALFLVFILGSSLASLNAAAVELEQNTFTDGFSSYETKGGSDVEARTAVASRCQNSSPLLKHVRMVHEYFNVWGRRRFWVCSFATVEERKRPTSIEQKTLQTRRINKPRNEVAIGLNQWIKNSGYTGNVGPGDSLMWIDADKNWLSLKIELGTSGSDSTLVRIRTFEGKNPNDPKFEVFSISLYQSLFAMIAQELFTEAINVEAAELN
jgi:hypothetical protein